MLAYLLVALGGALGSVGRFALSGVIARQVDGYSLGRLPWGTILVNVTGSLLIGLLAAVVGLNTRFSANSRLFLTNFLMIGVCGGYTTFSAFSLQTLNLLQAKHYLAAGGNVLISVSLCLVAVVLGYWLGEMILTDRA